MAIEGYVKFEYFSKGVPPYYGNKTFPELLDDEKITIETPNLEMSYHQYFSMFKKFMMAVGFDEKNIMQGACNLAFNEMNNEKTMREVAEEYDLIMNEDLPDIIADSKKQDNEWIEKTNPQWEERYWELYRRFNKFSSFTDEQLEKIVNENMQSCGHSGLEALKYSDEELDAMCESAEKNQKFKRWNGLIPGSPEAKESGCLCPVLDNLEMPDDKKWIDSECPIHGRYK